MQRAPTTPSLTAILRALWAHTIAQIAKGIDGVWVHPAELLIGPKDTSDRLYVEVGADVPEDAATLLREVAGKVKRGETRGEQSYCLGGYAFLVSEGERSTQGAVDAALPPWTREMGEACLRRLIAKAEEEVPGWDGLPELKSHVNREEYQSSAHKMAILGLIWFEQIPVEVLPYLPAFFEGSKASMKQVATPGVSSVSAPLLAGGAR